MGDKKSDKPKKQKEVDGAMDVVATQPGFYGQLREIGDRFTIRSASRDFSERWMRPYDEAQEDREEDGNKEPAGGSSAGDDAASVI